jgi:hypothetical protein
MLREAAFQRCHLTETKMRMEDIMNHHRLRRWRTLTHPPLEDLRLTRTDSMMWSVGMKAVPSRESMRNLRVQVSLTTKIMDTTVDIVC